MKTMDLNVPTASGSVGPDVKVLLDEGRMKIRRIALPAGAEVPPCPMKEDVVFIILSGRVAFTSESVTETVEAPGAAYIPGGNATRSMKADSAALVLAVLCRAEEDGRSRA